jgi:hypothetical protein
MSFRRLLSLLALVLLAVPAAASAGLSEGAGDVTRADAASRAQPSASLANLRAGRVIRTRRSWECTGSLRRYGRLPIKVISNMRNPGSADAIRLIGCYGDGNPRTIDLILDVNGNGRGRGTGYDAVKIGQNAHDLDVTGDVECGRRQTRDPSVHQDVVQALSGRNIVFKNFTSGNPGRGRWTCWGAGGGWYVSWANGRVPYRVICKRCRLATYNQNLRVDRSVRSGARRSVFGFHRSYGIFIGPEARKPINHRNRVVRY